MASSTAEREAKLVEAAAQGNLATVTSLLDQGVSPDSLHCTDGCRETALIQAAANGKLDVVTLLMQRGADPMKRDSEKKTAFDHAKAKNHPDVVDCMNALVEERNRDRISLWSNIGDRIREDLYDFTMKERLTLIRKGRYGEVESAIITGFSAIEDQSDSSALRKAFNEHQRRGGTTEESAVFSGNICKPRHILPRA